MNTAIVFKTDTTGLPDWKQPSEGPSQPHIVNLAAHHFDLDSGKIIESMDVIIKPDGWVIPDDVISMHGISNEYANDVGISEKQALEMFVALWNGRLRISHNAAFYNRIIRIATLRYSTEEIAELWKSAPSACTGLLAKTAMGSTPRLDEACKFFLDKEFIGRPTAIEQVNGLLELYMKLKNPN